MFRIDSDGATVGNRFTEGDPGLSIPATVVSDEILNNIQEEIIKPIEQMGIVLSKANEGQLFESLIELAVRGGRVAPLTQVIANTTTDDVAGYLLNKTNHLGKISVYYLERKTDANIVKEMGILMSSYNSKDDTWGDPEVFSLFDDSGVQFTINENVGGPKDTDAAQLEYTSDTLAGGSYVGELRLTSIIEIKA